MLNDRIEGFDLRRIIGMDAQFLVFSPPTLAKRSSGWVDVIAAIPADALPVRCGVVTDRGETESQALATLLNRPCGCP
jgi:hypothetical protein